MSIYANSSCHKTLVQYTGLMIYDDDEFIAFCVTLKERKSHLLGLGVQSHEGGGVKSLSHTHCDQIIDIHCKLIEQ